MRAFDRDAELLLQFGRAARMVDMAMGKPDLVDRDLGLIDGAPHFGKIAARIDDHGAQRLRAPQQRAILLERRDRNDDGAEVLHGTSVIDDLARSSLSTSQSPRHLSSHVDSCHFTLDLLRKAVKPT